MAKFVLLDAIPLYSKKMKIGGIFISVSNSFYFCYFFKGSFFGPNYEVVLGFKLFWSKKAVQQKTQYLINCVSLSIFFSKNQYLKLEYKTV